MAIIKDSNIVLSSDIGSVLNAAGGSVNINQPHTFFTSVAKLNKWSKKKPVRFYSNFTEGTTYQMDNCGLNIITSTSSWTPLRDINWEYELPRGGSYSEPYRLGDFVGYSTDAKCPISTNIPSDWYTYTIWTANSSTILDFSISFNKETTTTLGYDSFYLSGISGHLGKCYAALCLMPEDQSEDYLGVYVFLSSATIENGGNTITFDAETFFTSGAGGNGDSWVGYLCLAPPAVKSYLGADNSFQIGYDVSSFLVPLPQEGNCIKRCKFDVTSATGHVLAIDGLATSIGGTVSDITDYSWAMASYSSYKCRFELYFRVKVYRMATPLMVGNIRLWMSSGWLEAGALEYNGFGGSSGSNSGYSAGISIYDSNWNQLGSHDYVNGEYFYVGGYDILYEGSDAVVSKVLNMTVRLYTNASDNIVDESYPSLEY